MKFSRTHKVGVTGAGSLLGQGIVRSITDEHLSAVGLCLDSLSTGLYWCDDSMFVPMAKDDNYISSIKKAIKSKSLDALLVGTDVELHKLSASKTEIEQETGVKILVSDPFVIELGNDKYKVAKFFELNGLPATMSALPDQAPAIENIIKKTGFPLIVKPREGARSYGVEKVENEKQLMEAISKTKNPVIQECLGSPDEEYTASGIYFDGQCRAVIVMRRDLKDGNTYRAYTVEDKKLNEAVERWTNLVKPFGPINFQFRIDNEGNPKVFEINSRFSGTTPLRKKVGFNEVEMCLRYLLLDEQVKQPMIKKDAMILRYWDEMIVGSEDVLK